MTPLTPPARAPTPNPLQTEARLRQAARDFEAMAIKELLRPMFETVEPSRGPFGGGTGEAMWRPMMVEQIARQMAARGGLGLAEPILAQLRRMQEAGQPVEER